MSDDNKRDLSKIPYNDPNQTGPYIRKDDPHRKLSMKEAVFVEVATNTLSLKEGALAAYDISPAKANEMALKVRSRPAVERSLQERIKEKYPQIDEKIMQGINSLANKVLDEEDAKRQGDILARLCELMGYMPAKVSKSMKLTAKVKKLPGS